MSLLPKFAHHLACASAPIRIGGFLGLLLVFGGGGAFGLYELLRGNPNQATIAAMGLLFVSFLILVQWWGRVVYQSPNLLQHYGLVGSWQNGREWLQGLGLGLGLTLALFGLEAFLGWVEFRGVSLSLLPIVLEGSLTGLGVGLAEEVFFRGWLLDELTRDYVGHIALWASALIYALLHFIKPFGEIIRTLPQFPALVLLGLILVWAKRNHGDRLGMSMGLHGGLVWGYYCFNVGQIIHDTGRVSPWLTGVDANPLAGALGLTFLGGLALWLQKPALSEGINPD